MAGYVPLEPGDSSAVVQAALNAMNSEQYGAMATTSATVATIAALDAIPDYYLVTGKVVRVMDSDGLGTTANYSWSGSAWVQIPFTRVVGVAVASASSIAIVTDIFHITGAIQINTLTGGVTGQQIVMIPDGAFSLGTSGNIGRAVTATVGRSLTLTFDGTLWYPDA